jgi:hypothetical protein
MSFHLPKPIFHNSYSTHLQMNANIFAAAQQYCIEKARGSSIKTLSPLQAQKLGKAKSGWRKVREPEPALVS